MKRRLVPVPKTLALIPLFLSMSLVFMIACGEAAPAPAEPQTGGMAAQATTPPQTAGEAAGSQSQPGGGAKPTPTLFIDVIRRQPTPTAMAGAAPTAVPTAMPVTADVKYGGHVPMQTYSAPVTSRPLPEGT